MSGAVHTTRRSVWRWVAGGLGAVLAILAVLLVWVLWTGSGARFALGFVPGLQVAAVDGTLIGPLRVQGVVLEAGAAKLRADELEIDPRLWPLLGGSVHLDRVRVRGARVELQPQPTAVTEPAAPLQLPTITLDGVDLSDVEIAGLADTPVRIDSLRGRIATAPAGVVLDAVELVSPQLRLHAQGALDPQALAGQLRLRLAPLAGPATLGEIQLNLDSDGRTARLQVQLPGPARDGIEAVLQDLRGAAGYQVSVRSAGFDPAPWGLDLGQPLPPVDLQLEGDAHGVRVAGTVRHAEVAWQFDGTRLAWSGGQLQLDPLTISDGAAGRIHAQGAVGLTDRQAQLDLSLSQLPLSTWMGWPDLALDLVEGSLQLQGSLLDWQLSGRTQLQHDLDDLRLQLDLAGDQQRVQVRQLGLLAAQGERVLGHLALSGEMALAAPYETRLQVQVDSLDPGTWLPEWPGDLQLQAQVEGALAGALRLDLQRLQGQLKGVEVRGEGVLLRVPQSPWPQGKLDLTLGRNTLNWQHAADSPLELRLDLADPAWFDGRLGGQLRGTLRAPLALDRLEADLQGEALRWSEHRIGQLRLQANAGLDLQAPLSVQLGLRELVSGAHTLDAVLLDLQGQQSAHTLSLRADGAPGRVRLEASGGRTAGELGWAGTIQALEFSLAGVEAVPEPWRTAPLRLRAPVMLQLNAARQQWGAFCLDWQQAAVCSEGEHAEALGWSAQLALQQLPLVAARPWTEPAGVVLEGTLDGAGSLSQTPGGPLQGGMQIQGSGVEVLLLVTELPKRLRIPELSLAWAADADPAAALTAAAQIADLGSLRLRSSLDANDLVLEVDFASLQALEGLSADLANLQGQLQGQLRRSASVWAGELTLSEFAVDLPGPNLALREGEVRIQGAPDQLNLNGRVRSGAGTLQLDGRLDPQAGMAGLDLTVTGTEFLAADLPQLRVVVSPQLSIEGRAEQLRISGQVRIPEARIDLARFEPAVAASADVVYVDDPPQAAAAPWPVRADITVELGDQVALKGFGLDGRLAGRLSVRERPGRPTTARGEISVTGTYKAYGQDLSIERGKLLFANSGLDNPGLDIRAARVVGDIKAGVQVRGSADAPELTTYAVPSMDQLNTISYLVLGRPASQATGAAGSDAMQNAAQQLGGNLLAKSIGQKLGLEVGIESSAELGGASAFSVGKYLSPRLYVGYGRSLYDQLQLFIVRYRLREHYEVEATSGREQKIGIQYKRER